MPQSRGKQATLTWLSGMLRAVLSLVMPASRRERYFDMATSSESTAEIGASSGLREQKSQSQQHRASDAKRRDCMQASWQQTSSESHNSSAMPGAQERCAGDWHGPMGHWEEQMVRAPAHQICLATCRYSFIASPRFSMAASNRSAAAPRHHGTAGMAKKCACGGGGHQVYTHHQWSLKPEGGSEHGTAAT